MTGRIEITHSLGATIKTDEFENIKPEYKATIVLESGDYHDVVREWKRLREQAEILIELDKNKIRAEELQRKEEHITLIENPHSGRKYPRVSDILNPYGFTTHVKPGELEQHTSLGNVVHWLIEQYLRTGEWLDPREAKELQEWLHIMDKGNKGLSVDDVNYRGYFEKYGKDFKFDGAIIEERFFEEKFLYTGCPDVKGAFYRGRECIVDWKTGSRDNKVCFKQLAAYSYDNLDRLGVICPLKTDTKQGFSVPVLCEDLKPHFDKFLADRRRFKKLHKI